VNCIPNGYVGVPETAFNIVVALLLVGALLQMVFTLWEYAEAHRDPS
jgi:hypothetical protein